MEQQKEISTESKSKKSFGFFKITIAVIIAVIVTAIVTYFCTVTFVLKSYLNTSGMTYLSTKLHLVKQKLNNVYIYDLNEDEMLENAVKGYVSGVKDKYTEYLTKEDMQDLMQSTSGNYVGIGVYLGNNTENNTIVVLSTIEGSVAEEIGLKAGDIIKAVDGVTYTGEDLSKASDALKGNGEETEVKITILRDNQEQEFVAKRRQIRLKAVTSELKSDGIGYIKISTFNEGTSKEFKEAYNNLKKQNISGLIIDLRNNGGGLVTESLEVADTMVKKGNVVLITSNKNSREKIQKATQNPIVDVPVVILVNENTASASEILAGSLKDNCNYKIIGKTTYGKGVIQTVYSFVDGTGIKITSEEYFTPNHNTINKVGITPDIEVSVDEEWENIANIPEEQDSQLAKAIEELKSEKRTNDD